MRQELRLAGAMTTCVVVAACGRRNSLLVLPASQVPEEVGFYVADSAFSHGDTIRLVLENRGTRYLGFNLCVAKLERAVDGEWLRVSRHEEAYRFSDEVLLMSSGVGDRVPVTVVSNGVRIE